MWIFMDEQTLEALKELLTMTFPGVQLPENFQNLKMGDIPLWDSLGNLNLLLHFEEKFKVRLSTDEITEFRSIQQLVSKLANLPSE